MPMPHNGHGAVSEKPINPEDPTLKCAQNCLFDLEADPGETTDIKDKFVAGAGWMVRLKCEPHVHRKHILGFP